MTVTFLDCSLDYFNPKPGSNISPNTCVVGHIGADAKHSKIIDQL